MHGSEQWQVSYRRLVWPLVLWTYSWVYGIVNTWEDKDLDLQVACGSCLSQWMWDIDAKYSKSSLIHKVRSHRPSGFKDSLIIPRENLKMFKTNHSHIYQTWYDNFQCSLFSTCPSLITHCKAHLSVTSKRLTSYVELILHVN